MLVSLAVLLFAGIAFAVNALSAPNKTDFSIAMTSSTTTVAAGSNATNTVTITPSGGFTGAVTLSTSALPTGVTVGYTPANPSTATSRTLTFTAASTASSSTTSVTVTGTSGTLTHTTTLTLVVTAPTFSLSVTNDNVNAPQGTTGAFTIAINRVNGFSSAISFQVSGAPAGSTATFVPATVTGSSTSLQVATVPSTPTGSYSLTVTGTGGSITRTTTAHLTVSAGGGGNKPFTISGGPSNSLAPGVTAPINLSIYNPNNQPMQVTGLTVTVVATNKSACATDNYSVRQFSGTYPIVPANSTWSLSQLGITQTAWPAVTMINKPVNQDACKGATVQLGYTGTGSGS